MNQSLAPVMAPRAVGHVDSPDVLHVMRRFVWVLVAGTILGAGVAATLYIYFRDHAPRYKAFVQFQVLPPPTPLGSSDGAPPMLLTNDDTNQFIHRQVLYIKQQRILSLILQSKEFHTDHTQPENTEGVSLWYRVNQTDRLGALNRDLQVTPLPDAAAFEISMTTRDPYEAYSLVNAAYRVYQDQLSSDNKSLNNQRLTSMSKSRNDQEQIVRNASDDINQYQSTLNVPALTSRYKLELDALNIVNVELLKDEAQLAAAKSQLDSYSKQAEPGSNVTESAEVLEFINNDPQVRSLEAQLLAWEQERASLIAKQGTSTTELKMLDAREDKIRDQEAEIKKDLKQRAITTLRERADVTFQGLTAQIKFLADLRDKKEQTVKDLDTSLIKYQQKVDDLKAQQEILDRFRRDERLMTLNGNTDDSRVQRIVDPYIPNLADFIYPSLYTFMPLGTIAGFGLSFLLAYLLVWTDTRVRTPRDITKTLQLPLLGFIPDESDDRALKGEVATALLNSPMSMIAESFRQIRSQISAQTENSPVSTLLVASVAPGGGSTTVASNLAAGVAFNDRRVLLIDANFYRPSLAALYKGIPALGFSDVLKDPELLNEVIVASPELPKLHLMGAGSMLGKASSELLESRAFRDLLEQLRSRYDLVIFDGAPLNLVADSLTLAARVDAVISVIRAGEVSRGTVTRIREHLRQVHANLLGFILNAAQTSNTGYFKENYRTFYRYAGQGARRPKDSR